MGKKPILMEGSDFYYNEQGSMVLTRQFLLKRGFCCQSGCLNCPYDFSRNIDPDVPIEFQTNFNCSDFESEEED